MVTKCVWHFVAANKQQWRGFVAAASCGLVAACAFFVCNLVFWLSVAATLLLLVVATLRLIAAATLRLIVCRLFAALCVQRVCRPSCRLFQWVGYGIKITNEKKNSAEKSYVSPICLN